MATLTEKFVLNLKVLRASKGLTQGNFAKAVGLNIATISLWERGKGAPTLTHIQKIIDTFDLSDDYLFRDL